MIHEMSTNFSGTNVLAFYVNCLPVTIHMKCQTYISSETLPKKKKKKKNQNVVCFSCDCPLRVIGFHIFCA